VCTGLRQSCPRACKQSCDIEIETKPSRDRRPNEPAASSRWRKRHAQAHRAQNLDQLAAFAAGTRRDRAVRVARRLPATVAPECSCPAACRCGRSASTRATPGGHRQLIIAGAGPPCGADRCELPAGQRLRGSATVLPAGPLACDPIARAGRSPGSRVTAAGRCTQCRAAAAMTSGQYRRGCACGLRPATRHAPRQMNTLALLVQEAFKRDPAQAAISTCSRQKRKLIKILWHDGLGMSLYAKAAGTRPGSFGRRSRTASFRSRCRNSLTCRGHRLAAIRYNTWRPSAAG